MINKELKFNKEAREELIKGVDKLANGVRVTLGPRGKNVIIEQRGQLPIVTKDGVTVANNISFTNPYENLGCQLIKDVANRTANDSGDGTTTATLLTQSLLKYGNEELNNNECNLVELKDGMDTTVHILIKELEKFSKKITNNKEIEQVATISSNNDTFLGKLIASAYEQIGHNGIITTEISKTNETHLEIVKGFKFGNGYLSQHFINDFEKNVVNFENPYIIVTNQKINVIKDINKLLEKIMSKGKPFVIICEDIEQKVLGDLAYNVSKGLFQCCVVKTPRFGMSKKSATDDIAMITGSTLIDGELDMKLNDTTLEQLGTCDRIIIKVNSTVIVGGNGDDEKIQQRIEFVRTELKNSNDQYSKEKNEERLANLTGGVGIIYIGGSSESEIGQKKDRIDDAIFATKSSIEEGIIVGGGVAYHKISKLFENLIISDIENKQRGINIILKTLKEPLKQLCENSGLDYEKIVYEIDNHNLTTQEVHEGKSNEKMTENFNYGFNMLTNKYSNLVEDGVIDPFKVIRTALENSVSIAGLILTTDCVIVDVDDIV